MSPHLAFDHDRHAQRLAIGGSAWRKLVAERVKPPRSRGVAATDQMKAEHAAARRAPANCCLRRTVPPNAKLRRPVRIVVKQPIAA